MRNEDFGLSECPFYIAHPPSPKHTHVHTHALISMHTRPVKDLRTAVGHGLAWHFGRDGEDGCAAVNMYVYTACMKSTHTLSTNNAVHEDEAQFGGKQWKTVVGLGGG